MNTKLVILFGMCFAMAFAGPGEEDNNFTINQASDLLKDLLNAAVQNLSDLNAAWEAKQPILEENIQNLDKDLSNKQEECAGLDTGLAHLQKELEDAQVYAEWIQHTINDNQEKIKNILEKRCEQNGSYIESLKNDKIALKLVEFLRVQITNKESFNFAQRKAFNAKLQSFLSIYQSGSTEELVQLEKQFVESSEYDVATNEDVQARSNEEIGSGHIDNNQGDLQLDNFENGQRKGWLQVKQELLDILNQLEQTISAKIATAQNDEVRSNTAAADFKIKLEHEIEVYAAELLKVQAQVHALTVAVQQAQENVNNCRSEESVIQKQLEDAKQQLVDETAEFQHKSANIQEEVAIFEEVIALYDPSHTDQANDFKKRTDDFIDNGEFDNGDYAEREVPKIDLLNQF